MGASFSNSSTSNVPSVVSKTSMGSLSFGDALAAREIAVRGYVSEAGGDKRPPGPLALGLAVFQRDPAARPQVPGSPINKSEQGAEAIAFRRQCPARFVSQPIAGEGGVVGGDVGRVADQGIEAPTCDRRIPV